MNFHLKHTGPCILESFNLSPFDSIKITSYFDVYEELFSKYVNQEVTFVEVGILNGGSLFMWRDYLGPKARIIGIDLSEDALKWEEFGFEIYIGDQSSALFWENFFSSVGTIDVILDDGGHTYKQQITTVMESVPFIKSGGLIVVEDTHSSYLSNFGSPSKRTFIQFTKGLIDSINQRYSGVESGKELTNNSIYSVSYFESIVSFQISPEKCLDSRRVSNKGKSSGARDARLTSTKSRISTTNPILLFLRSNRASQFGRNYIQYTKMRVSNYFQLWKFRKYFW